MICKSNNNSYHDDTSAFFRYFCRCLHVVFQIGLGLLVGLYIQSKLKEIFPKSNFRLYRDFGLALLRNFNGQQIEKVTKNVIGLFKDIGFNL